MANEAQRDFNAMLHCGSGETYDFEKRYEYAKNNRPDRKLWVGKD